MKNPRVSIVIPIYNERSGLRELIHAVSGAVSKSLKYELVCVDDGSTDGSYEELKRVSITHAIPITIVRFRRNFGKSAALSEGFRHAKGAIIVTLDADLQDDPREISGMVKMVESGYDVVVGWRKIRNDSFFKRVVSGIYNRSVSVFTGVRLHDMNCGLKVMKKVVTDEIHLYGQLHRYIPVLASQKGFRVTEVPVSHHARKYGISKYGLSRIFAVYDLMTTLFLSGFGSRPMMVFGPPGTILIGIGIIALTYLSILHFMGQSIGTRPLLLLGTLCVLFGLQLVSTGLLGELITSMYSAHRKPSVSEEKSYHYHES